MRSDDTVDEGGGRTLEGEGNWKSVAIDTNGPSG